MKKPIYRIYVTSYEADDGRIEHRPKKKHVLALQTTNHKKFCIEYRRLWDEGEEVFATKDEED